MDWLGIDLESWLKIGDFALKVIVAVVAGTWAVVLLHYLRQRAKADAEGKPFEHHLSHLAIHGFLHLIGYDHENDTDAEEMESLETEILEQLGIPDPYADRERMN